MGEFDEIIGEFLVESQEALDQLDQNLIELEERPSDRELLARIFRCVHTIKGTSGFFGFSKLEGLTHAGESLLSKLRDGELTVTADATTLLLSMVDAVRGMLRAIKDTGADGSSDYHDLIEALRRAARGETGGGEPPPKEAPKDPPPEAAQPAPQTSVAPEAKTKKSKPSAKKSASLPAKAQSLPLAAPSSPVKIETAPEEASLPLAETAARTAELSAPIIPPVASAQPAAFAPLAPEAAPREEAGGAQRAEGDARKPAFDSVRVDVELLDHLVDLAGELVLTRNQIRQLQALLGDGQLSSASQRLNLVTLGLQEGIMRMRMQPIDNVLSKFPRMVRDLARACKKLVRVEIDGKNTELDKSLIESIKDPLTHLLRNSVDHGIESPEERTRKGKHPEGRILVRAAHEGGQVCVEISDDGAGIDLERVRAKAVSQSLVPPDRAGRMSREELINLIFLPGFSTAKAVTNVSGRGVGMDVVKTNVEHMGGTVEIETDPGRGTTFRIRVPLTLAILPALIVCSRGERYAVPQASLQELVVVDLGRSRQKIERVHGAPVYRLRDKLLPLVFLSEQLGTETREDNFERAKAHIAVLFAGGRQFGLVVDQVSDQQEIVVKPLATALKSLNVYAGATIMGDGRVVLILDVVGLAQRASLATSARDEASFAPSMPAAVSSDEGTLTSLLLLRGPDDARLAVPLSRVARLHTPLATDVEEAAGNEVLQYGDEIMPIVNLARVLPERRLRPRNETDDAKPSEHLNLVVVSVGGAHVGISVHEILDVVDVKLILKGPSRAGVVGTMVIHGRVTELLDLDCVIAQSGVLSTLAEAV